MARPDRSEERRAALAHLLARAFSDLGYRRATTSELASRLGIQEKSLFRLWPDKRAMFLAALDQVFLESETTWARVATPLEGDRSAAERLLDYEADHHGDQHLYRIIFAGLSETDDPEIRAGLARLFGRFHHLITSHIETHRAGRNVSASMDATLAAWAIVGLGTVANIGRELNLLKRPARASLLREIGSRILNQG